MIVASCGGKNSYYPRPVGNLTQLDEREISRRIYEMVNRERQKKKTPRLRYSTELAFVARHHSENMLKGNYMGHGDHLGRGPSRRVTELKPEIFGGIGENVALNFGQSNEDVARRIMTAWMNSPGHRRNILRKKYTHIGAGIAFRKAGRGGYQYYRVLGTQVFGDLYGRLLTRLPSRLKGGSIAVRVQYLGKKQNPSLMFRVLCSPVRKAGKRIWRVFSRTRLHMKEKEYAGLLRFPGRPDRCRLILAENGKYYVRGPEFIIR